MAAFAITTAKTVVFERFHFFYLFSKIVSGGMILDLILTPFGDLGEIFFDL